MRKLLSYFLLLVVAMHIPAIFAQAPERSAPAFTLAILEDHQFGPGIDRLRVIETNISNDVITEAGCVEARGWLSVSVVYNGIPLEEKDATARHLREAKGGQVCTSERASNEIKPGQSREHWVSVAAKYNVTKPGTYEISVARETYPDHPEKSVTVKSNTLIIVVPEPDEVEPK
jgi:hypothetical protein